MNFQIEFLFLNLFPKPRNRALNILNNFFHECFVTSNLFIVQWRIISSWRSPAVPRCRSSICCPWSRVPAIHFVSRCRASRITLRGRRLPRCSLSSSASAGPAIDRRRPAVLFSTSASSTADAAWAATVRRSVGLAWIRRWSSRRWGLLTSGGVSASRWKWWVTPVDARRS